MMLYLWLDETGLVNKVESRDWIDCPDDSWFRKNQPDMVVASASEMSEIENINENKPLKDPSYMWERYKRGVMDRYSRNCDITPFESIRILVEK